MTLEEIRGFITKRVGERIVIKQKISHRAEPVVYDGIIQQAYGNLFIVALTKSKLRNKNITFNYRDILTHTIEIEELQKPI